MKTPSNKTPDQIKAERRAESMRVKQDGDYIRNCAVYFKEENVGQERINKVINWYNRDKEIAEIVRAINGNFTATGDRHKKIPAFGMIDVYSILYAALLKKQIKQRRKHLEFEMRLDEFYQLFIAWRKGYTNDELLMMKTLKAPKIARQRVIASIKTRFYTLNREIKEVSTGKLLEVLRGATVTMIDGRPCYVIYMDEVDPSILEEYNLPRIDPNNPEFPLETTPIPTGLHPIHTELHQLPTGKTLEIHSLPAREIPVNDDATGDTLDNLTWDAEEEAEFGDPHKPPTKEQEEDVINSIEENFPLPAPTVKEAEGISEEEKNNILNSILDGDDDE